MKYYEFLEDIRNKDILVVGNGERRSKIDVSQFDRVIRFTDKMCEGRCDYGVVWGFNHRPEYIYPDCADHYLTYDDQFQLYPHKSTACPPQYLLELHKYGRHRFSGHAFLYMLFNTTKSDIYIIGFDSHKNTPPDNLHYNIRAIDQRLLQQWIKDCRIIAL